MQRPSILARRRNEGRKILVAAEDLISRKGFHETTISEIAAKAGVADSVIYHHFKSKQDLVFSIAGNHMRDILARLQEHLEGILDPVMTSELWNSVSAEGIMPDTLVSEADRVFSILIFSIWYREFIA